MRLGIDGSTITPMRTGVGQYAAMLLDAVLARPEIEAVHLFSPGRVDVPRRSRDARLVFHEGSGGSSLVWRHAVLPRLVHRLAIDCFHFPNTLAAPLAVPYVVTVHDLTVRTHPWAHPFKRRLVHRLLLRRSLEAAAAVVAVSATTARDLLAHYPRLAPRLGVVRTGAPSDLRPPSPRGLEGIRRRYRLPPVFVLAVGGGDPRKNLPALAEAVRCLRARTLSDIGLVVTGPDRRAPFQAPWLLHVGYVARRDLAGLYAMAAACAYPSFYEGFGLPPLEAMRCSTPVVASSAGAIPEIVGDAALLVNPDDPGALADALDTALHDRRARARLIRLGRRRAAALSWKDAAQRLVRVYRFVAGGGKKRVPTRVPLVGVFDFPRLPLEQ